MGNKEKSWLFTAGLFREELQRLFPPLTLVKLKIPYDNRTFTVSCFYDEVHTRCSFGEIEPGATRVRNLICIKFNETGTNFWNKPLVLAKGNSMYVSEMLIALSPSCVKSFFKRCVVDTQTAYRTSTFISDTLRTVEHLSTDDLLDLANRNRQLYELIGDEEYARKERQVYIALRNRRTNTKKELSH